MLEVLDEKYSNSRNPEIGRGELLDLCQSSYDEKYGKSSELGHNAFQRCLNDLEEDMAITIAKKPRRTIIKFNIERIKKLINDIRNKQGFYRLGVEVTPQEIDPKVWEQYLEQLSSLRIDNFSHSWITNLDERYQYAHLIAQSCASGLTAVLVSSRFGFTLIRGGKFESIDNDDLCQLAVVTSKIASKDMNQPFRLLIDFSGAPQTGSDWGPMWNDILSMQIIIHFQLFAEEVLKFKFNNADLDNLRKGHLDNLSGPAAQCYEIFKKDHLLPYLKIIGFDSHLVQ